MEIVEFLAACLDEDERIARAADPGPWKSESLGRHDQAAIKLAAPTSLIQFDGSRAAANGTHAARHDPARVLREVEMKRSLVAAYADALTVGPDVEGGYKRAIREALARQAPNFLMVLALPFADRPGFAEAIASVE